MAEQAVILAAGRGSRLSTAVRGLPKCLTPVGSNSLVRHQIDSLRAAGIQRIAVVVGYADARVRAHLPEGCTFIRNAIWAKTNSVYSLGLASRWVRGSFVVVNSDVLAHPSVFRSLMKAPPSALVYDSSSGHEDEHMKVRFRRGTLEAIGKNLTPAETHGENVGILKFDQQTGRVLFREIHRSLAEGHRTLWAPEVLNRLAKKVELHGVDINGMPWIEIDFPEDLERAHRVIWPRIGLEVPSPVRSSGRLSEGRPI